MLHAARCPCIVACVRRRANLTIFETRWSRRSGHAAVVRELAMSGADLNRTNWECLSPLAVSAAGGGRLRVFSASADRSGHEVGRGGGLDNTATEISQGHVDVVRELCARGAALDAADRNGRTPVFAASAGGYLGVVDLLAAHKADLNKSDRDGNTPLLAAAERGHVKVVRLLLKRGTALGARLGPPWCPLGVAAARGRVHVVRELLRHGRQMDA